MYIGFDVGNSGAYAILDSNGEVLAYSEYEIVNKEIDCKYIIKDIYTYNIKHAFVERAQAMPKQGVSSMFTYGKCFGLIIGILNAISIPYTLISPQSWKKAECIGLSNDKSASIVRVKQLYPNLFYNFKLLKRHHNICDAILICRYGIKKLGGI